MSVKVPDVVPAIFNCPVAELAKPMVGVAVKAGPAPARTAPAAPVTVIFPVEEVIESGAEAVTAGVPEAVPKVIVGVPAVA